MNKIQKLAEKVTFNAGGRSYTRNSIDSIQLLHYRSLDCSRLVDDRAMPRADLSCLASSELVVFYDQQELTALDEDIGRTVLHCISP